MKKYFILSVLLLVSGFFASCNYLNIDDYFEDTFQEDSIYANKRNIERYFNGAAALLPVVDKIWEYREHSWSYRFRRGCEAVVIGMVWLLYNSLERS